MATPLKRKAGEVAAAATSASKKPKANASITSFFKQTPETAKPASSTQSSPLSSQTNASPVESAPVAPKFDKVKWIEKLTDEQKDLLALEIQTLDESWLAQLKDEVLTKEFLDLKRFLKKEHESGKKIFPPADDVYSW